MADLVDSHSADLNSLNYTVLIPYNGTVATGGDSLTDNLNVFYEVLFSAVSIVSFSSQAILARRSRMDSDLVGPGPFDDSRRWVSVDADLDKIINKKSDRPTTVSSIPVWRGESQLCRSSGFH